MRRDARPTWQVILSSAVLLFWTPASAQPQPEKAFVFAFADATGTRLVTLAPLDDRGNELRSVLPVQTLTKAICAGNDVKSIEFERHQNSGPKDSGKQTEENFSQLAGDIFRISSGKIEAGGACVLTTPSYFARVQMTSWQALDSQGSNCPPDLVARFTAKYQREVNRCSVLVKLGREDVVAVEFRRQGNDLLAAEAIVSKESLISHTEAATCRDNSGWRVDDDCEFSPAGLNVFFAWKSADGGIQIGVSWNGAEGEDLVLFSADQNELREAARAYRYHGS